MNPDPIHGQLSVELDKMEKARKLLAGEEGKWYRSPYDMAWLTVMVILVLGTIVFDMGSETMMILLFVPLIGIIGGQVAVMNKRIDKIVELTAVEKTLEEKYKATIKAIAERGRLASPQMDDEADTSTA